MPAAVEHVQDDLSSPGEGKVPSASAPVVSSSEPVIAAPPPPADDATATAPPAGRAAGNGTQEGGAVCERAGTSDAAALVQDTNAKVEVGEVADEETRAGAGTGSTHGRSVRDEETAAAIEPSSLSPLAATPAPPRSAPPPVTPEDLARQLADFRVAPPAPPLHSQPFAAPQQPEEEEWLLKSIAWPPLPPTPYEASTGDVGPAQGFETDERLQVRIICQNANGPCSLIALCNILILRNELRITPGRTSVMYSYLSNLLADYFLRATSSASSPQTPGTELSLEAALSILPQTRYGLNLNPRFDRIDGFSSSSPSKGELALFALARIPLLHGWLADPASPETYDALVGEGGCGDYDTALERVVEGAEVAGGAGRLELAEEAMSEEEMLTEAERMSKWTEEEEQKVRRAYLIKTFLTATSTQLTYPGLSALCTTPSLLPPSGLAALFRNSHLSVLYRRPSLPSSSPIATGPELFTLVTDAAFAGEQGIVWESMEDVDGAECAFFDGALRRSSIRGGDWVGASGSGRTSAPVVREGAEDAADVALAQQLQAEEDAHERRLVERARARDTASHRPHARPSSSYSSSSSGPPAPPVRATVSAGRADSVGAGAGAGGRAAKKLSRVAGAAGGKGKAEKDKCVVM
ncbi:hypothetical protein JCM10450v2_002241 [Rhodotorula kratochvilovae]